MQSLIAPLQQELGIEPIASSQRRPYGLTENNMLKYDARIAAIDYTLAHDDGISLRNLELAQVILLGVSRSGKTPTSLYLALQFGVYAVNYPFIADDMDHLQLPPALLPYKNRLFGLTIDPNGCRRSGRSGVKTVAMHHCDNAVWSWLKWRRCIVNIRSLISTPRTIRWKRSPPN